MLAAAVQIDHRRDETAVPQQLADSHQVDPGFEQGRRKTVAQCIHTLPTNSGWRGLFIVFIRFSIDQ